MHLGSVCAHPPALPPPHGRPSVTPRVEMSRTSRCGCCQAAPLGRPDRLPATDVSACLAGRCSSAHAPASRTPPGRWQIARRMSGVSDTKRDVNANHGEPPLSRAQRAMLQDLSRGGLVHVGDYRRHSARSLVRRGLASWSDEQAGSLRVTDQGRLEADLGEQHDGLREPLLPSGWPGCVA